MSQQVDNNLKLFRELITCGQNVYMWTYDSSLALVSSNCPDAEAFQTLLMLDHTREALLTRISTQNVLLELVNSFGLIWIAAPEYEPPKQLSRVHMIGPAFYNDISVKNLEAALDRHHLSIPLKLEFLRRIESLPVVSLNRFREYGLMLHYCITGEKIAVSDIQTYENTSDTPDSDNVELIEHHGTWAAEQEMLKVVEEGNLDYRHRLNRLSSMGNVGKMSNGDPIRQAKNSVIIFTALCSRSAIRGGLSPETAFSLSDRYLQNVEACDSLSQIGQVSQTMLTDFILRVHECKITSLSPHIKECCDYISLHADEKLNIETLASTFGYSKYYLSRKFKQETGMGIREYIKKIKIEKAKNLLLFEKYSIQEISEMLGFHSQSYFGEIFHEMTGMTPGEFRDKR